MNTRGKQLSFQTYIIVLICILVLLPIMIIGGLFADRTVVGEGLTGDLAHVEWILFAGGVIGLVIGYAGALFLTRKIKSILFGFEPVEIAKMWQERNAMLEAVHEGIIAVNSERRIVVANHAAIEMFRQASIYQSPLGEYIEDYFPGSHMRNVMQTGLPEYDQEVNLNGNNFYVNNFPVLVSGQVVGAISTFRDKTELKQLAEQLTGIKIYTDALRSQTHEFMNKLHVILGMIHIGQMDNLIEYIHKITNQYQLEVGSLSQQIKDPVLAGFLLSKISIANDNDIKLGIIAVGSVPIPPINNPELLDDVITVIGNLIDNAFDAVKNSKVKVIEVALRHSMDSLTISVKDNGDGISYRIQGMIFEKSFSTKGKNRGYGLYLIKKRMERIGGSLTFKSTEEGTTFIAVFPYEGGEDVNDFDVDY